jgi:negative regulator of genetic competence, sporulation and motility
MAIINYPNAQSTLTLNGNTFQHLAEGESLSLAPVNAKTARTNSVGGGLSVSNRIDGGVHNLTVIVQKHSPDDKLFNDARNSESPIIFNGSMKRAYTDNGTSKKSTTSLTNGTITTQATNADNNQESDNSRTYVVEFRDAKELF